MTREPLFTDAKSLIRLVLSTQYFKGKTPAIPYQFKAGTGSVVVITGENGGGKSFFRRIAQQFCRDEKVEAMHISMEGRSRVGEAPWMTLVYGNESRNATGVLSVGTVKQGINTVQGRTTPNVIIWDEPDIGASDSTAASMGEAIFKCWQEPLPHTKACLIITHRKALVERLLPLKPHYLYLGSKEGPKTVKEWLNKPIEIKDLETIQKESHERFLLINALLPKPKPSVY